MDRLKHLFIVCIGLIFLLSSCLSNKVTRKDKKTLSHLIETSPVFSKHFTGFVLYDPKTSTTLVSKNARKYFTPASNTKILSLYTALHVLGDSLPVLHYVEKDSSLIFWGTGNPLFLHPDFSTDTSVFNFLKNSVKQLKYYSGNYQDHRYGEGWMWDDYPYAFHAEKSPFPIYGNTIRIELNMDDPQIKIQPTFFEEVFTEVEKTNTNRLKINREEKYNFFEYSLPDTLKSDLKKEMPFVITETITRGLLNDTLKRLTQELPYLNLDSVNYQTLYQPMTDSIYRRLMHQSDNFIAEQLLLLCSDKVFGIQDTKRIIEYAKAEVMPNLPDELLWADGSGISRYNLFTPRSLVEILNRLHQEIPEDRLFNIFSAGGETGTIAKWYKSTGTPYIFAKTGTLRNNHNLSGYIKTSSGRLLIFSFMHNHYKGSSGKVKEEMASILQWIHETY